jgi:hypothetical protein
MYIGFVLPGGQGAGSAPPEDRDFYTFVPGLCF